MVLEYLELDTPHLQVLFWPSESAVVAHHHSWYAVEQNGAGAHVAGRKCGIQGAGAIFGGFETAGSLETIGNRIVDHAPLLHSAIAAPRDNLMVQHQHRTDREAAFLETGSGFF